MRYLYELATDKRKGFVAGLLKFFLFLLSLLYGACVRILIFVNRLFQVKLQVKVVSVGNLTVGGTGKTALVEYIVRVLRSEGHKVAVLTRGYGKLCSCRASGPADYESMGDEPYMLSRKLAGIPVIVDADRVRGADKAQGEYSADTVILDDGFQQWRIKKDLEIVAVDAGDPFGNRNMLPRGILREPLSSLRRADICVVTKANLCKGADALRNELLARNPRCVIAEAVHAPLDFYRLGKAEDILPVTGVKGKSAVLFSGIGDPASFEILVKSLGMSIFRSFTFRDHHRFTRADIEEITNAAETHQADMIVTTEKDASRLAEFSAAGGRKPIMVLRIAVAITKEEAAFRDRLHKLYSV